MNPVKIPEKPILFSSPMVQATFADLKTQTRRIVKPEIRVVNALYPDGSISTNRIFERGDGRIHCPYGQPGHRLWVRETFFPAKDWKTAPLFANGPDYLYRADEDAFIGCHRWKPSIFMPRAVSRLTLEIINIRVERLNAITADDARAEGVSDSLLSLTGKFPSSKYLPRTYAIEQGDRPTPDEIAIANYAALWESLNGAGSWNENPYVWVIEFKRL